MSAHEQERTRGVLRKVGLPIAIVVALMALDWCVFHAPLSRTMMSVQGRAVCEVACLALALDNCERSFGAYAADTMPEAACSPERIRWYGSHASSFSRR